MRILEVMVCPTAGMRELLPFNMVSFNMSRKVLKLYF